MTALILCYSSQCNLVTGYLVEPVLRRTQIRSQVKFGCDQSDRVTLTNFNSVRNNIAIVRLVWQAWSPEVVTAARAAVAAAASALAPAVPQRTGCLRHTALPQYNMGSVSDWKALRAQFEEQLALSSDVPSSTWHERTAAITTQERIDSFQPSIPEWIELIQDLKASASKSSTSWCCVCSNTNYPTAHMPVTWP